MIMGTQGFVYGMFPPRPACVIPVYRMYSSRTCLSSEVWFVTHLIRNARCSANEQMMFSN